MLVWYEAYPTLPLAFVHMFFDPCSLKCQMAEPSKLSGRINFGYRAGLNLDHGGKIFLT